MKINVVPMSEASLPLSSASEVDAHVKIYPFAFNRQQAEFAWMNDISDFRWQDFKDAREELGKAIEYWRTKIYD